MLTEEQHTFFEEEGYLVIPNALTPEELARARHAADMAEARWRADPSLPGVRRPDLEQVLGIMEYDPFFAGLLEHRIHVGDSIETADLQGEVREIGFRGRPVLHLHRQHRDAELQLALRSVGLEELAVELARLAESLLLGEELRERAAQRP